MTPTVQILLASYNGERFLQEQISSILQQSHLDWQLLIRDDGSSDGSVEVCRRFESKHPERIRLLSDARGNLGVVGNFSELLSLSSAPYVMFSDQDDVWLPDKISISLGELRALEQSYGLSVPMAVFTDAVVTDETLQPLAPSLLRYINRQRTQVAVLNRICVEPNCYGCTMMLNRALVAKIGRVPPQVISHDWWAGMVATAFGRLVLIDQAPILHRRHTSNQSATQCSSLRRYLHQPTRLTTHRQWLAKVWLQCAVFSSRYASEMDPARAKLFADLAEIPSRSTGMKWWTLLRHRVRMTGFARNVAFYLAS